MTFFLHIKGQAAFGVTVQRSVCLEMSASLCLSCVCPPGESLHLEHAISCQSYSQLCCAVLKTFCLLSYWHNLLFPYALEEKSVKTIKEPHFEKESKVRALFQKEL